MSPHNPMKPTLNLRVLSYNIHQGLTILKKRQTFKILKEEIKRLKVDVVLLQEVAGTSATAKHEPPSRDELLASQLEALADESWPYHAYGRNSVFSGGYHGNAILSRFPIKHWKNVDITVKPLSIRGCLHGELQVPDRDEPVHVIAAHLGLLQTERRIQLRQLGQYITKQIPGELPVLIGGDFNDWREIISKKMHTRHGFDEAFRKKHKKHARTFPSGYPVLCLDRIYFRGFHVKNAHRLSGAPWNKLSDHLPLTAEFSL